MSAVARAIVGIVTLFVAVAPVLGGGEGDSGAKERALYSANGLLARGYNDLAAAEYEAFIEAHPGHAQLPTARYGLAVARFREGAYPQALEQLNLLVDDAAFAYAPEVACMTARSLMAQGRIEEALTHFKRVAERYPEHPLADDAYSGFIEGLYTSGSHAKVISSAEEFAGRYGKSPFAARVAFYRGRALLESGRYEDAHDAFRQWLSGYEKNQLRPHALLATGECLRLMGRNKEAEVAYRKAGEGGEGQVRQEALLGLAAVQQADGRPGDARSTLETFLTTHPDSDLAPRAYFDRGRALFDEGEFDEAGRVFRSAVELDKSLADRATYWLARCASASGNYEEAAKLLREALNDGVEDSLAERMRYDLSVALVRSGKGDAALETLGDLAAGKGSQVAEAAMYLRATELHRLGRYEESLNTCRNYLSAHEDGHHAADCAFLIGENLFLSDQMSEAATAFKGFLEDHAGDAQEPRARFRLAVTLLALDSAGEAESLLKTLHASREGREFPEIPLLLGDLEYARGEWKSAATWFDRYLAHGPSVEVAPEVLLKSGLSNTKVGSHEEALEKFDRILEDYPSSELMARVLFEKGRTLLAMKRKEEAADAFSKVVEADPEGEFAAFAHSHLGALAAEGDGAASAATHFRRAAELTAGTAVGATARFQEGAAQFLAGEYEACAETLGSVLALAPEHPLAAEGCAQLSMAQSRRGECEDAKRAAASFDMKYREAVDTGSAALVAYDLAWCFHDKRQDEAAAESFARVLDSPAEPGIRLSAANELSSIQERASDLERAESTLSTVLEGDLHLEGVADRRLVGSALYRLGVLQFKLGRFEPAASTLDTLLAGTCPEELSASALFFCGDAHASAGALDKAASKFEQVVADHAESDLAATACLRLGQVRADLQQWSRSERAFGEYLSREPAGDFAFQAKFGIGWAQQHLGRHEECLGTYREVVAGHNGPTAARAQFQIGECLFGLKRYEDAARELLKVDILYKYPEWSAAAMYEAGRCFDALQRRGEAVKQYKAVVDRFGESEWATLAARRLAENPESTIPGQEHKDAAAPRTNNRKAGR